LLQLALSQTVGMSGGLMPPLDPSTKHARKIYVGNLPLDVTEFSIMHFFNETLNSLLPSKPPGNVVIGCYLNIQRRFAFIEHRSIEEANFTLSLDGISYAGLALKLRRPQDYNATLADAQLRMEMQAKGGLSSVAGARAPSIPSGDLVAGALGIISTTVEDGPNKVFIGGLPHHMGEPEVKQMLAAFGSLKSFHLVKSKGFAFCEWRDPNVTDLACHALNNMRIGERVLNVRRAVPHAVHKATSMGVSPEQAMFLSSSIPGLSSIPMPGITQTLGLPQPVTPPTSAIGRISRVLAIKNMVPLHQMSDTNEVERIVEEAKEECVVAGELRSAQFFNGQVMVEFASTQAAVQAMKLLQGKQYDGRMLSCSFSEPTPEMKLATIQRIIVEAEVSNSNAIETKTE